MFGKFILVVLACLVGILLAVEREDLQKYGPYRIMLNSPIVKCMQNRSQHLDVNETTLYFYDFANNFSESFPIQEAAKGIRDINNLDKTRQFIMFVGGFTSAIHKEIEEQMREAYKTHPNSYFMIPDHSPYTYNAGGSGIKSYQRSVTYVHAIGKAIGHLLATLKNSGISPKNIHLVGHSLGGQILGHAGAAFIDKTGKKIARITALDPAGPCFSSNGLEDQVRSGIAEHVDIYHCNSGALGSTSRIGDTDFVINGGEAQPHCNTPIIPELFLSSNAASCNHRFCIDVWTASVKSSQLFSAYTCDTSDRVRAEDCEAEDVFPGATYPGTKKGIFHFWTEDHDLTKLR